MTAVEVRRPPRPAVDAGLPEAATLRIAAPPAVADPDRGGLGQALLACVGSLGMVGFALVGGHRLFLVLAILLAAASLAGTLGTRAAARRRTRRRRAGQVERWEAHLASRVAAAADAAVAQRAALRRRHSDAAGLLSRARGGQGLWECGPGDSDRWRVALGTGPVPARVRLLAEGADAPLAEHDLQLLAAAEAAAAAAASLPAAPVVVDLAATPVVALVGPRPRVLALARAIVAELTCARPPAELSVAVATARPAEWQWVVFLPHLRAAVPPYDGGLLVLDGCRPLPAGEGGPGVTLCLAASPAEAPSGAGLVVEVDAAGGGRAGGRPIEAVAGLPEPEAAAVARALAPLRPAGSTRGAAAASGDQVVGLLDLLGGPDGAALDVPAAWAARPAADRLRVPVGVDQAGRPLLLDLREAAEGGCGPHGLVVGATGSGKSELLRALVTGLALRHAPSELALVLVDFKGGAAFHDVAALPHVAGLVTNLCDDPALLDRVGAALRGELERRQRVLRDVGAESLRDHDARRRAGEPLPALPSLLVVIDEFGEMLAARPELLDVLGAVGRLGRSLGVHLLLCSQRFEEGRLRGLESHLRYRVCLRVVSTAESTAVLGVPDAARLPAPGHGYLAVDGEVTRFRAAHTSRGAGPRGAVPVPLVRRLHLPAVAPAAAATTERPGPGADSGTERGVVVRRILAVGAPPVSPVWLPPLPGRLPLAEVLAEAPPGELRLPVGRCDLPARQATPPYVVDLAADGHLAVVGAPGAGASTLLRTLAAAAALRHGPHQLHLAALDFGGGGLQELDRLPHTRCVAGPADPDLAAALLRHLRSLVEDRSARGRQHGWADAAAMRAARVAGLPEAADAADVLLLVDGLARVRERLDGVDDELASLAATGLRVGVHLVVTAHRWADLRPGLRDLLAGRLELRLADPADSAFPRGAALGLAGAPAGRAVTSAGVVVQVADPAGVLARAEAAGGAAEADARPAPRVLPFPARAVAAEPDVLALREGDLAPVRWDGGSLLVLGDRETGRTGLLRRLLRAEYARATPREVLVIDPRRRLRGDCDEGTEWTAAGPETATAVARLAGVLTARLHGGEPGGPWSARGWHPAGHLLLVDDADVLQGGVLGGPLAPLADLVRCGPEVGLTVVLARSVTGSARAAYDPFLAALRESACTGLLLAGDPAEGPVLGGRRAVPGRPAGRGTWLPVRGQAVEVQVVTECMHEQRGALAEVQQLAGLRSRRDVA